MPYRERHPTSTMMLSVALVCGWLLAAASAQSQTFTDVTGAANISNPLRGPGLAWGDYDGDGDLDLYITAWTLVGGSPLNKLWQNNGDGTFTNTAAAARIEGFNNFSAGAAWGDYNNDGKLDLYVANFLREEQDFLYRNLGNGTFDIQLPNTVKGNPLWAAWGDYNLDGNLDLYLARFNGPNLLFRNNGNGSFTNVTTAGVGDVRDSDRATWVDYDNDGDPDLYVVNHNQESQLFRNKGSSGQFTFENVTATAGVGGAGIGKHAAWADYDNDGDLDLFVANIGANILYRNNNDGTFTRVSVPAGVAQTGAAWVHWFAGWADYNLDGKPDLFVASGAETASGEQSTLFANNGNGTFTDVTPPSISATDSSAASAWGDYDNDGDADLYILNYGSDRLYRNDTAPSGGNAFLKVRPFRAGKAPIDSSAEGIGAKVWVYDAGTTTLRGYQEIISGADALEALFGLSTGGTYDVVVKFTSRTRTAGGTNEVVVDKNDNPTKYGGISVVGGKTLIVKESESTFFP